MKINSPLVLWPGVFMPGLVVAAAFSAFPVSADHLPNPAVTASARSFSASFPAANLFDTGVAEYATAGQGAVSAPFTTNPNDGTWVEFDFGGTVTFDQFVMTARLNAVDVVATSRLIVSADPVFDASDTIFTFNPSGSNGAGLIHNLGPVSGRYARWEVLTRSGTGLNLGARQMYFLNTRSGQVLLPAPIVINSATPFNSTFAASQAVNGNAGDGGGNEYACQGLGAGMFVDFDFAVPVAVSGFDFWNRPVDRVTTFNLIFADSPDFSFPQATLSFTADPNGNRVNSANFEAVTARYVRLQATGAIGGNNTGIREIQFYTPTGQAPFITQQPQGGTRLAGDRFTATVAAGGDTPRFYQWWNDTDPLNGATNASLILTNLQVSDSGGYSVVISNAFGSITSQPLALIVLDPAVDLASDLRAWFKMDETSFIVAADSSGNGNHGTLQGFLDDDTQWVAGRIDGGLEFNSAVNGLEEVVLVPDAASQLDFSSGAEFSLAVWVRGRPVQESGAALIAKGTGAGGEQYAVDVNANAYRFFVRSASGTPLVLQSPISPDDTWQHVVAVYSRTLNRMRLYVNKAEVGSATPLTTDLLANNHEVSLGARQLAASGYDLSFNGAMDDVRIYARALTPKDVSALYDEAPPEAPTIVQQPRPVIAVAGSSATFSVVAGGSVPLTYEWRKAGVPIPNANARTLTLTNVQPSAEADYTVRVSNTHGAPLSDPAHLTVMSALQLAAAPVQASSLFNLTFPAANAFDGLRQSTGPNTARWASATTGAPHWLYVDLGADFDISRVAVDWETASGRDFTVRVRTQAQGTSENPDDWSVVASVAGYTQTAQGIDGVDAFFDFRQAQVVLPGNTDPSATTFIESGAIPARYVMLHTSATGGTFPHVSVWEFQIDAISHRARILSLGLSQEGALIRFEGAPGRSYEVQRATDLSGPWETLSTIQAVSGVVSEYLDAAPPQPVAFYQVVIP
jgi:hypothetical protein